MIRARAVAVAAAAAGLVAAIPSVATAETIGVSPDSGPVTTVTRGLDGPRQVSRLADGLVVAESDTGRVTAVDPATGATTVLMHDLYHPQGVAVSEGRLFVALGGAPPPDEGGGPQPGQVSDVLLMARTDGHVYRTVDLLAYELKHNPDRQEQFVDGKPVDALSNPYAVWAGPDRVLVADAGGNDVLSIDPQTGRISTFFVPPVVKPAEVPGCGQVPNNPGTVGCDAVPTGVTRGPDGLFYVSTLGAEVPGAGRVYVLDPRGHVVRVIRGLDAPTGIEALPEGSVVVSELLYGAPEGAPPPGFDPAAVGRLVRIDRGGNETFAQVTMPTGIVLVNGRLYASAWSVASFLGLPPGTGEIDRVPLTQFHPAGS